MFFFLKPTLKSRSKFLKTFSAQTGSTDLSYIGLQNDIHLLILSIKYLMIRTRVVGAGRGEKTRTLGLC
jgi:hypothetical protein